MPGNNHLRSAFLLADAGQKLPDGLVSAGQLDIDKVGTRPDDSPDNERIPAFTAKK